jgi:hypothetical protein
MSTTPKSPQIVPYLFYRDVPAVDPEGHPWFFTPPPRAVDRHDHEEVNGKAYANTDDARLQIGEFIETVYNRERLHSALGARRVQSRSRACHRNPTQYQPPVSRSSYAPQSLRKTPISQIGF